MGNPSAAASGSRDPGSGSAERAPGPALPLRRSLAPRPRPHRARAGRRRARPPQAGQRNAERASGAVPVSIRSLLAPTPGACRPPLPPARARSRQRSRRAGGTRWRGAAGRSRRASPRPPDRYGAGPLLTPFLRPSFRDGGRAGRRRGLFLRSVARHRGAMGATVRDGGGGCGAGRG